MKSGSGRHRRRSIRLKGYDYSRAGAYFVTICAKDRACLFGEVVDGRMVANGFGRFVQAAWEALPQHYPHVALDVFVVMPNHMHGILMLNHGSPVGAGFKPAPTEPPHPSPTSPEKRHALPEIVRAFKTFSARRINALRGISGVPVWQRNYYEHVIRDESSLRRIREYIADNPLQWEHDRENPAVAARRAPARTLPKDVPWLV